MVSDEDDDKMMKEFYEYFHYYHLYMLCLIYIIELDFSGPPSLSQERIHGVAANTCIFKILQIYQWMK